MQMHTKCCCTCCMQIPPHTFHCKSVNPCSDTFTMPCRNYLPRCPCASGIPVSLSNQTNLPLKAMQKALVAKYTELEKLGQLAHNRWCQRQALQQQMDWCRLNRWNTQEQGRIGQANSILQHHDLPVNGTYTGTLKIREADSCKCNHQDKVSVYNGVARLHDQDQQRKDNAIELDKFKSEQDLSELSNGLAEAIQQEQETQQQLQSVRSELACLQSKIKSFWGDNALDKCTPAKENRTKFF